MNIPANKKLTVTYRVEPGCLGPEGKSKVDDFCVFVQKEVEGLDADYIVWDIHARHDKSLPEMQFSVLGKRMTRDQAETYLSKFEKCIEEFEGHLVQKLTDLIDVYMGQ